MPLVLLVARRGPAGRLVLVGQFLGFIPFDVKGSKFYPVWLWPAFFINLFSADVPLAEVREILPTLGLYILF